MWRRGKRQAFRMFNNYRRKWIKNKYMERRGKSSPYPALAAIPLIAQCNRRCTFCEIIGTEEKIKSGNGIYHPNILSVDAVRQLTPFLRKVQQIDFGGLTGLGEPLLSPCFKDNLSYIRSINREATLTITTNALMLDKEMADFIADVAPAEVTFSLHAASEAVFRQAIGSGYSKVIKNIEYFSSVAKKKRDVAMAINFGLGKHNRADSEKIIEFAKGIGVDVINYYPYYKSANSHEDDISLYNEPEAANAVLDRVYAKAQRFGQRIVPMTPAYIQSPSNPSPDTSDRERRPCLMPFDNFILKANPYQRQTAGLCVCNRIVPFLIDFDRRIELQDLEWAWRHPFLAALRLNTDPLEICRFCKDPGSPGLRSLNHMEYKKRRDEAVRRSLSHFQGDKESPGASIHLLSENIYSI